MPDPGVHHRSETDLLSGPNSSAPLKCRWENCEASFASGEELYKHICDDHTVKSSRPHPSGSSKRVFHCRWDDCKIRVNKRDHLVSHVRVHVDIWPFSCEMCDRKFRRPQDLKKHLGTSLHQQVEAMGLEKAELLNQRHRKAAKAASPPHPESPETDQLKNNELSPENRLTPENSLSLAEEPRAALNRGARLWGSESADPKSEPFTTTDLYTNQYVDLYMDQFRETSTERSPPAAHLTAPSLFPGLDPGSPGYAPPLPSPSTAAPSNVGSGSHYRGSLPEIKPDNYADLYSQYSAELSQSYPIIRRESTGTASAPAAPPASFSASQQQQRIDAPRRKGPNDIDVSNFPDEIFADLGRNQPPAPPPPGARAFKMMAGPSYSPQTGVNPYAIWGSRTWRPPPPPASAALSAPQRSPLINVPQDLHELWNLPRLPVGIMPSQRDAPPPTPESLHQDHGGASVSTTDRGSSPSPSPLSSHSPMMDPRPPLSSHSPMMGSRGPPSAQSQSPLHPFPVASDEELSFVTLEDLTPSLSQSPSLSYMTELADSNARRSSSISSSSSGAPLAIPPGEDMMDNVSRAAAGMRAGFSGHLPHPHQFRRPSMPTRGPQLFERVMQPGPTPTPPRAGRSSASSHNSTETSHSGPYLGPKIPINQPNQRILDINEQRSLLYQRRDFRTRQYNYYTADLDPEGFYNTPIQPISGPVGPQTTSKKRHMKQESMDRTDFEESARRLSNQANMHSQSRHNHRAMPSPNAMPPYGSNMARNQLRPNPSGSSQELVDVETPLRATRSFYTPGSVMTPPISDGKNARDGRLTRRRSHPANMGRNDPASDQLSENSSAQSSNPSLRLLKNGTRMAKDFLAGIDFSWKKNTPASHGAAPAPPPQASSSTQIPPPTYHAMPPEMGFRHPDPSYGPVDGQYMSPIDSEEGKKVMRIKRMKSTEFPPSNYGPNMFDREIFPERRSSREDSSDLDAGDDSSSLQRRDSSQWSHPSPQRHPH